MAKVTTPAFRVSYPNVFKPKKNDMNGKDEYSLVALFPKDADLSVLKAAVQKAIEDKWGTDKAKWPQNLKLPFRNQGDRKKTDPVTGKSAMPAAYVEGAVYLNLKSEQRPGLVDQNVQDIIDSSQFYAGCWARASLNAFAYDTKGNRGVAFGLGNIQKMRDDDPLSGRSRPQDDFAPIEGAAPASAVDIFS